MSRANAYGVVLLGYAPDGTDARGNVVHRVRWADENGTERTARTRGHTTPMFHGIGTGARVDLFRDGRGSIIRVERAVTS